jgi:FMN phosphatase YigB (HAD superfamily)
MNRHDERAVDVGAILWDFGDTLADERWMLAPLAGVPAWPQVYRQVCDGALGERWNIGIASALDVAEEIARRLSVDCQLIVTHMQRCSANLAFYDRVMAYAKSCSLPQAIVNVNPDIFSQVVVPTYHLDAVFADVITSWELGTVAKWELCQIAADRLRCPRGKCLLIDNVEQNVNDWRQRGGMAYHFVSDEIFARDYDDTLLPGTCVHRT